MVKHDFVKSVMDVKRINPIILSFDVMLGGKMLTVLSVYESQSGRSEKDKDKFYLSAEKQSKDGNSLLENFNGFIGSSIDGCEGIHGRQEWGNQNKDGERLVEFARQLRYGGWQHVLQERL